MVASIDHEQVDRQAAHNRRHEDTQLLRKII
jgi:hypothetical protein